MDVEVKFEKENIDTLLGDGEHILTIFFLWENIDSLFSLYDWGKKI